MQLQGLNPAALNLLGLAQGQFAGQGQLPGQGQFPGQGIQQGLNGIPTAPGLNSPNALQGSVNGITGTQISPGLQAGNVLPGNGFGNPAQIGPNGFGTGLGQPAGNLPGLGV